MYKLTWLSFSFLSDGTDDAVTVPAGLVLEELAVLDTDSEEAVFGPAFRFPVPFPFEVFWASRLHSRSAWSVWVAAALTQQSVAVFRQHPHRRPRPHHPVQSGCHLPLRRSCTRNSISIF